jgi:hypothetical protein
MIIELNVRRISPYNGFFSEYMVNYFKISRILSRVLHE